MIYSAVKRALDFSFALLALIVLSPLMLFTAIVIRIESPREKAIFKQERLGKDLSHFYIYKFRTMVSSTVDFTIENPSVADGDDKVLRCGKIFRKLKIDELPQLFNILRGDMSIIGPRPLLPIYANVYERWELDKFKIKPGLSGLSQIKGNSYLPTNVRSYYDILYSEKKSLLLDAAIVIKTFAIIFFGEKRFIKLPDQKDYDELVARHSAPDTEVSDDSV